MTFFKRTPTRRCNSRGISLIIVLIMMMIIGITAATAMRSATSEQRATNNQRVKASAKQYAEAALRYCESELAKSDDKRVSSLQNANIKGPFPPDPLTGAPTTGWEDPATWTGTTGRSSASRTLVRDDIIQLSATETVLPPTKPECIAENMAGYGLVITARGFSHDYKAPGGNTISGAVVWLQSFTN